MGDNSGINTAGAYSEDVWANFRGNVPEIGDVLQPAYDEDDAGDYWMSDLIERLHVKFFLAAGSAGLAIGVFLNNYQ